MAAGDKRFYGLNLINKGSLYANSDEVEFVDDDTDMPKTSTIALLAAHEVMVDRIKSLSSLDPEKDVTAPFQYSAMGCVLGRETFTSVDDAYRKIKAIKYIAHLYPV